MNLDLTPQQASEVDAAIEHALHDMSHEIAATDNSHHRGELIERRHALQAVEDSLHSTRASSSPSPRTGVWTIELSFVEDGDRTQADARMRTAGRDWHGWGRARRSPLDPDVPAIGEELAAARALSDLSHQLVGAAAGAIETFEGHSIRLHP